MDITRNNKIILKYFAFIVGALLIIPPLIYILNFFDTDISDDANRWGVLGDYVGGILNPILGVANLIVLIYLTLIVSNVDEKNNEKNLVAQKKITLSQLRMEAYKDLASNLESITALILKANRTKQPIPIDDFGNIILKFQSFTRNMKYLFPILNDQALYSNVQKHLSKIMDNLGKVGSVTPEEKIRLLNETTETIKKLNQDRLTFCEKLQMFIISELD